MKSYDSAQKIIDQIRQERAKGRQSRPIKIVSQKLIETIRNIGKILFRTALITGSIFVIVSVLLFVTSQQKVAKKEMVMNTNNAVSSIKKQQIKNKAVYTKKEIIGYTIYLKNGKRIRCKQSPTTQNGTMTIVEGHIRNEIPLSWISKIEGTWQ